MFSNKMSASDDKKNSTSKRSIPVLDISITDYITEGKLREFGLYWKKTRGYCYVSTVY